MRGKLHFNKWKKLDWLSKDQRKIWNKIYFACFPKQEAHRPWCSGCGTCNERPQMTLTYSRSKMPTCILHTPPRSKFSSLSLYDEQFFSYGPFFWKVHQITQMTLTCSRSKIPTCMLCIPPTPLPTPRGLNFCPFRSRFSHSRVTRLFRSVVSKIQADFQNCQIWA